MYLISEISDTPLSSCVIIVSFVKWESSIQVFLEVIFRKSYLYMFGSLLGEQEFF